ncbi:MAG: F0F1 ATP synthase subunit B [Patescibacteria group bacterium]
MGELFAAFGVDWKLLIAQGVNFLIVFGGLTFFLYKPLMHVLAEREAVLKKGLDDAREASEARAVIEQEKTGILTSAQKEAGAVVERAVNEAKNQRTDILKTAQERAEGVLSEARTQAEELKRAALAESEKEMVKVAILAAEKILKEKIA